jgi:hypothetical protein
MRRRRWWHARPAGSGLRYGSDGSWERLDLPFGPDPWITGAVPSPRGWCPPSKVLPAWNWLPPNGLSLRLDRMSWWVNAWYRIPWIDRYAYAYMWNHGGWDTLPERSSSD